MRITAKEVFEVTVDIVCGLVCLAGIFAILMIPG